MTSIAEQTSAAFRAAYGIEPDGVWSAPGRVNVLGEHTDYNAGLCLPMALAERTYAAVRLRDDGRLRIASTQVDGVWEGTLADVGPRRPAGWVAYVAGVFWALAERGVELCGFDVLVDGRVPLGAGLSSSAALECAVAVAVADLVPAVGALSRADLAAACVTAENVVAGASTGGLDQTISLEAVAGHVLALDCRDFSSRPVPWHPGERDLVLLVVDTRAPHALNDGQYAARRTSCEEAAALLGVPTLRDVPAADLAPALDRLADPVLVRRVRHVVTEIGRVRAAVAALDAGDDAGLGALMTASHVSLRDDYEVSCPELDVVVETAAACGALGARMTGGGFGGSAIALVDAAAVETTTAAVRAAFVERGFGEPAFLVATAGGPAVREL